MAIQFAPLPFTQTPESLGMPDYHKAIQNGLAQFIQMKQAAPKLQQAETEAQYAEPLAQMKQRLYQAQIDKMNRPSEIQGETANLIRLRDSFPEGSKDRERIDRIIENKAAGNAGMQLSVDPVTHAITFSSGGSRNQPGATIVNGQYIQKPTTPLTTAAQKGSVTNLVRESMANNFNQPYVGTGSNASLLQDRILYSTTKDPEAKKKIGERLINAALAMKLAPEYAALQLQAQGTTPSVQASHQQEMALKQGWAEALPHIVGNLPKDLEEEVKRRHDQTISSINKTREQFIAKGLPIDLENKKENKPYKTKPGGAKGETVGMMKNGVLHFIPVDKAKDAHDNWGYEYEK